MSIIASDDSRNVDWSKNSIGSKLLLKMGWKEGTGLGRDSQGTALALRAVRKSNEAGIGAKDADITGNDGWNQTTDTFASVLKNLKSQHSSLSDETDTNTDKKKKKKKKLVLAVNKVTAGHSRKMREAKDLTNKSQYDMAAIFGNSLPTTVKKQKRKRSKENSGVPSEKEGNGDDLVSDVRRSDPVSVPPSSEEGDDTTKTIENDCDDKSDEPKRKKKKKRKKDTK
jgi:G-patch domain